MNPSIRTLRGKVVSYVQRTALQRQLPPVLETLALLLDAGNPLSDAVTYLTSSRMSSTVCRDFLNQCAHAIETGRALTSELGERIPALLYVLLSIGESTGMLSASLNTWRILVGEQQAWKRTLLKQIAYPAVLMVSTLVLMTFLGKAIIPTFLSMYQSLGVEPPPETTVCAAVMTTAAVCFWTMVLLAIFAVLASCILQRTYPKQWDSLVLRSPLQKIVIRLRTRYFCLVLGTLLKANVTLVDALKLLANMTSPLWIHQSATESLQRVLQGYTLGATFTGKWDPLFHTAVEHAEQTGELGEALLRLENTLRQMLLRRTEKIFSMLQPSLLMVSGGSVAMSMYLLFVPLYSTIEQISGGGLS